MDPVVDIVYGVGVLLTVLKSVRINSGCITSSYGDIGDVRIRCRILRGHETRGC